MKTVNLTKWSNLYSTELKCKLTLKSSLFPIELVLGLVLSFLIVFSFTTFDRAIVAWQYALLSCAFVVIFHRLCVFFSQYKPDSQRDIIEVEGIEQTVSYQHHQNVQYTQSYQDPQNSHKSYSSSYHQLMPQSRIAYWGFYLVLAPITNNGTCLKVNVFPGKWWLLALKKQRTIFIDKRQLSRQEYSRLAYIIKRTQSAPLSKPTSYTPQL